MSGASGISEHAASGAGLMRDSPLGRVAVPLLVFVIIRGILAIWDIPYAFAWAIAGVFAFEAIWLFLRRKHAKSKHAIELDGHADMDAQKDAEFKHRYRAAQRNGDFDRFNK